MKKLLWLDDVRDPTTEIWNNYIAKNVVNPLEVEITWVKRYRDFVSYIENNGLPKFISFDHDLEDFHISKSTYNEKTGLDCAKWLVDYCINNEQELPNFHVHSANPVGRDNINGLLYNFLKVQDKLID